MAALGLFWMLLAPDYSSLMARMMFAVLALAVFSDPLSYRETSKSIMRVLDYFH